MRSATQTAFSFPARSRQVMFLKRIVFAILCVTAAWSGALTANADGDVTVFGRRAHSRAVDVDAIAKQKFSIVNTSWRAASGDASLSLVFNSDGKLLRLGGDAAGTRADWRDYGNGQYLSQDNIFTLTSDSKQLIERTTAGNFIRVWKFSGNVRVTSSASVTAPPAVIPPTTITTPQKSTPSPPPSLSIDVTRNPWVNPAWFNSVFIFRGDGTFQESFDALGKTHTRNGTWSVTDTKTIRMVGSDHGDIQIFSPTPDGLGFTRYDELRDARPFGIWREKIESKNQPSPESFNFVGTKWKADTTIELREGGVYWSDWAGGQMLKWSQVAPEQIETHDTRGPGRSDFFIVTDNGTNLMRERDGKKWRRVYENVGGGDGVRVSTPSPFGVRNESSPTTTSATRTVTAACRE